MKILSFLPFLLIAGLFFNACSSGTAQEEKETSQGFPIPYPEEEKMITDEWNGSSGHITLRYDAGRYEEIVAFYDKYASGSDWNRTEAGKGEFPSVMYMNLGEGLTVDVGPPDDQVAGAVLITLYVSE